MCKREQKKKCIKSNKFKFNFLSYPFVWVVMMMLRARARRDSTRIFCALKIIINKFIPSFYAVKRFNCHYIFSRTKVFACVCVRAAAANSVYFCCRCCCCFSICSLTFLYLRNDACTSRFCLECVPSIWVFGLVLFCFRFSKSKCIQRHTQIIICVKSFTRSPIKWKFCHQTMYTYIDILGVSPTLISFGALRAN